MDNKTIWKKTLFPGTLSLSLSYSEGESVQHPEEPLGWSFLFSSKLYSLYNMYLNEAEQVDAGGNYSLTPICIKN